MKLNKTQEAISVYLAGIPAVDSEKHWKRCEARTARLYEIVRAVRLSESAVKRNLEKMEKDHRVEVFRGHRWSRATKVTLHTAQKRKKLIAAHEQSEAGWARADELVAKHKLGERGRAGYRTDGFYLTLSLRQLPDVQLDQLLDSVRVITKGGD